MSVVPTSNAGNGGLGDVMLVSVARIDASYDVIRLMCLSVAV